MSTLDLTIILEILMEEEIALAADMQNEEEKLPQQNEENPDQVDLADQRLHQEIVVSRLSLINQRLTQVRAALKRLDEGKYGICARCGKDINPERLKVIPYTTFCVSCQEHLERANR